MGGGKPPIGLLVLLEVIHHLLALFPTYWLAICQVLLGLLEGYCNDWLLDEDSQEPQQLQAKCVHPASAWGCIGYGAIAPYARS